MFKGNILVLAPRSPNEFQLMNMRSSIILSPSSTSLEIIYKSALPIYPVAKIL